MKPLSEMTHYEILEITSDATDQDIERAYRMAQATWGEDGLATYSLYEDGEAEAMRERIEFAHRVLGSEASRQDYDLGLSVSESLGDDVEIDLQFADAGRAPASVDELNAEIESFEDAGDETGEWTGSRLRRTRLLRSIDIEKIAEVTKINPTYLQFLEGDQYEDLPAKVYVRGFVVGYARCLGLDAERVAASYLQVLREVEAADGASSRAAKR